MEQKILFTLIGNTVILINSDGVRAKLILSSYRSEVSIWKNYVITSGGINDSVLGWEVLKFIIPDPFPSDSIIPNNPIRVGCLINSRMNHTQTVYKNFLYIIGGSIPKNPTNLCEKIDLDTGESFPICSLPLNVMLHTALLHNERIYIAGGLQSIASGPKDFITFLDLYEEN